MNVSVIIAAYNAEDTIADTLASLQAQTHLGWEAIVVEDGSGDGTAAIAESFVEQDSRIRIVARAHRGVSAVRNTGISLARFNWLLFLDADDWLLPQHLERMTASLVSDTNLDAVHCGWARIAPDGTRLSEEFWPQSGDMFPTFARLSAFPIHCCVVRRPLVEAVGGFDTSFRTCEDWDLWQRIARTGARFGAIHEVLALYRMRPTSASMDGFQMLADGLRVITQGHSSDPRVSNPNALHAGGLPRHHLPGVKLTYSCWSAGLVLGHGGDARPLLQLLREERCTDLNPQFAAQAIFKAALLPHCYPPGAWEQLWPSLEQHIDEFLRALEAQSLGPGLARRARVALERLILENSSDRRALTAGATHVVRVEVTEPISDILTPAEVVRLHCFVELEGVCIGTLDLPVCDGIVPGYVLMDAVAAEFAWTILGRFFEYNVYPQLEVRRDNGVSVWRAGVCLANNLPDTEDKWRGEFHGRVGWTVFLQEVWGRPGWSNTDFYSPEVSEKKKSVLRADHEWIDIEVSGDLPSIRVPRKILNVVFRVGGVGIGVVQIPSKRGAISAQELQAALTQSSGFELCRGAVREALLGRSLSDPTPLRARLAAKVTAIKNQRKDFSSGASFDRAAGLDDAVKRALLPSTEGVVLGRHPCGAIGTSVSRRATLPVGALSELVDAASLTGQPMIRVPETNRSPARVVYAPDLIEGTRLSEHRPLANKTSPRLRVSVKGSAYDRHHFEALFSKASDPWQYGTPYEQTKYERTLSLVPPDPTELALELGCAEGHFTVQLAPRVGRLIAADISQIALERAAKRCVGLKNISFKRIDINQDSLPGPFDLIVCSEVLYYVGTTESLRAAAHKLGSALDPGGYLLMAHANLVVDEPDRTGFDWDLPFGAKTIGEVFGGTRPLQLVKELRTPLYRIHLFKRDSRLPHILRRPTPEVVEIREAAPLPTVAATARIQWNGGYPQRSGIAQTVVTERLPILMYHRVAEVGSPSTAGYRVTPEIFETHLRYLRDAGYHSVNLEDWWAAMEGKKPLPGRAVILTFDDGYLDFKTQAWPLLKRYGFSAIIFLVAGEIGGFNSWDRTYGEEVPLLAWDEIRGLRDEGVEFGSHSTRHDPLGGLSIDEVVREAVRSRVILQRGLDIPVDKFAYPYGDHDQAIQHLIGACGYVFGLSCRQDLSTFRDSALALPRIEVAGSDSLEQLVVKLTSSSADQPV